MSVLFLNPKSQPDLLSSQSLTLTFHRYENMGVVCKDHLMQTWQWVWANMNFWEMFMPSSMFPNTLLIFGGLGYNISI